MAMNIRTIDERDMNLICVNPSFRVIDVWLDPSSGAWDKSQTFDISSAGLLEVLEWAKSDRQSCNVSEVYAYDANPNTGQPSFILLHTVVHR
jgi:hypothetical protein